MEHWRMVLLPEELQWWVHVSCLQPRHSHTSKVAFHLDQHKTAPDEMNSDYPCYLFVFLFICEMEELYLFLSTRCSTWSLHLVDQ